MRLLNSKTAISCVALALLLNALPVAAGDRFAENAKSSVIRMTPPAPVFDENTRLTELANRRMRVGQAIGN